MRLGHGEDGEDRFSHIDSSLRATGGLMMLENDGSSAATTLPGTRRATLWDIALAPGCARRLLTRGVRVHDSLWRPRVGGLAPQRRSRPAPRWVQD